MKKIIITIMSIVLVIFSACNSNENKKLIISDAPIEVNIVPTKDTLTLSKLFNSCKLLELKGILLSDIVNIEFVDSLIIVQSKSKAKDIHLFNNDGEYIKSLFKYGRARDETINIQSMSYNKFNNSIDVLCNFGMEIRQYSLRSDSVNKITIPKEELLSVNDIECLDEHRYMIYKCFGNTDNQEYKLYIYNHVLDIVEQRYLPFDKQIEEKISIGQKNNLYCTQEEIIFYETFQNGLYSYKDDKLSPKVSFKKNKYTYPISKIVSALDDSRFIKQSIGSKYIWAHINFIQYNKLYFSYFTYLKEVYLNVINSEKSNSYYYINDDLTTNRVYRSNMLNIISQSSNQLICNLWDSSILETDKSYLLIYE